jgi:hypothetical protein
MHTTHERAFKAADILPFLQDQTALVTSLIKADKELAYLNTLYNRERFNVRLHDGSVTGSVTELMNKLHEVETAINRLEKGRGQEKLVPPWSTEEETLGQLRQDRTALEYAKGWDRDVYEWLLVPFWLSEMLHDKGEVVLRLHGNSWWGITAYEEGRSMEWILTDLCNQLALPIEEPERPTSSA